MILTLVKLKLTDLIACTRYCWRLLPLRCACCWCRRAVRCFQDSAEIDVARWWSRRAWWRQDTIRRPHPWTNTRRRSRNAWSYVCSPTRRAYTQPIWRHDASTRLNGSAQLVPTAVRRRISPSTKQPAVWRRLPDARVPTAARTATAWFRTASASSEWRASRRAPVACCDDSRWLGSAVLGWMCRRYRSR